MFIPFQKIIFLISCLWNVVKTQLHIDTNQRTSRYHALHDHNAKISKAISLPSCISPLIAPAENPSSNDQSQGVLSGVTTRSTEHGESGISNSTRSMRLAVVLSTRDRSYSDAEVSLVSMEVLINEQCSDLCCFFGRPAWRSGSSTRVFLLEELSKFMMHLSAG